MKKLVYITAIAVILSNCKKETEQLECKGTPYNQTVWVLEKAEHVRRLSSNDSIVNRSNVVSHLYSYDHKFHSGIYYQSPADSNHFTVAGSYSNDQVYLNIGGGLIYVKSSEGNRLILERILVSLSLQEYLTERNTFKKK
jgi:hypothetical protein